MNKMVRVNIRISDDLNMWLDEESKRMGVSKSILIHLALIMYMQQKGAICSFYE